MPTATDHSATTELLREVRLVELQTARLVDQHLAGSYQSIFKGRGIAFSEVRAYEPGDDVRTIDWNVTARTGEPHVKQFSEERQLTVLLVVDMSRSLDFGSRDRDKRSLVARLAATFAFSASRSGDRIGLLGFTDEVEVMVPPRSGRKHVLSVISRLLSHETRSIGTRPEVALEQVARFLRGHAIVVVISDFIAEGVWMEHLVAGGAVRGGGATKPAGQDATRTSLAGKSRLERAFELVRRRHDVIPIRVEDPLEVALPPLGIVDVEDLELGWPRGALRVDLSARRVRRYAEAVERERRRFDDMLARMRIEGATVRCGEPWQDPLVRFFARRARRMRR